MTGSKHDKPTQPPARSRDTDPRAEEIQIEIFRQMRPAQKMQLVADAFACARELALAGLRLRYPDASPESLERLWRGQLLGEELANRVYGPLLSEV
jgi:hypothetical protein